MLNARRENDKHQDWWAVLTDFRIDARQVRTFVQITIDASESKIVEFVAAAVKSRNDVLDVKNRQRRIILMKLAILAAVAGAFPNGGSRRGIHRLR
jgi:hypothetical protein